MRWMNDIKVAYKILILASLLIISGFFTLFPNAEDTISYEISLLNEQVMLPRNDVMTQIREGFKGHQKLAFLFELILKIARQDKKAGWYDIPITKFMPMFPLLAQVDEVLDERTKDRIVNSLKKQILETKQEKINLKKQYNENKKEIENLKG